MELSASMHSLRVVVCVATYRRREGLERLLGSLQRLTFRSVRAPEVEIAVVDNDPDGTAAPICDSWSRRTRWPIAYLREERRGISHARNRAVAYAVDRADFLAFVDDDETVEANWLEELLAVQLACSADVVTGPVLPRFEGDTPAWLVRGEFYTRPRYPTGHRLDTAATNNTLVRAEIFRRMDVHFDERFALTGGEDTHFFFRVTRSGGTIVWADRATVSEWIPPSRLSPRWILQRAYRRGNAWTLCERDLDPSPRLLLMRLAKGLFRLGEGLLLAPWALLFGRHALLRSIQTACFGAGNLTGLLGLRYEEYRPRGGSLG